MLFRRLAIGLLLVVGVATIGAQQTPTTRIVLIAGRPSHGPGMHEHRAGSMLLQKALSGYPGVTVEVFSGGWPTKTVDEKPVDDHEALDGAAAVFIYADGGSRHPALQGDRVKVLDGLAAKGVGLGFAHYAVEVPAGVPGETMQRWIGGYYETNYSVNPMWKPTFDKFPTHQITRGVGPFATHDEWYFSMRWTPDPAAKGKVTPILVSTPSDEVRKGPYVSPRGPYDHIIAASGQAETMMWVFERPGGSRGMGFTGGHTHANWGDPNQRKIMLNALLWLAKVEVPAKGVVDTITEADLAMNLDDKPVRRK